MTPRDLTIRRLGEKPFDVVVAGAGINGAVTAAALAARGVSVALLDRGDFGGLTSQESSNLVWGGIKYLENYEVALVRDLCQARNRLLEAYPTNVREVRFYTAVERDFKYPPWMLGIGTWIYWAIGRGFTKRPRLLTRGRISREEPLIDASRFAGGVEYSDAMLVENDARFVFGFVRSAIAWGAVAANYVEVLEARREGANPWEVRFRDVENGQEGTLRARVLVNAAGPYVDDLNASIGATTRHRHVFSKGIHLIVDRITHEKRIFAFFDAAERLFFVIPMGHRSVIGTTDTRVERPEAEVTEEDRRYLLDQVNARLSLPRPLQPSDVIAERCGVRPLAIEGAQATDQTEWLALSRRHVLEVDPERRLVSLYGGKLTDCVNVGEEMLRHVAHLGVSVPEGRDAWFGEPPDPVRIDFERSARALGLDELRTGSWDKTASKRIWRRHGIEAFEILEAIRRDGAGRSPVLADVPHLRSEIEHISRREAVVRLDDFLRRRTKIALLLPKDELARLDGIGDACRLLFGKDAERRYREFFGADLPPSGWRRRILSVAFGRSRGSERS